MPDFPWNRLRNEHPLVYESAVQPMPTPTDWFHAEILVDNQTVSIFVNRSHLPSLTIKRLGKVDTGKIGLLANGLKGDYANLAIEAKP
jgi:hypothetical protein